MPKAKPETPTKKTDTVQVEGKNFTVIRVFEGTKTASQLLCEMAVRRVVCMTTNAQGQL
ncbi:MAG: hypothetical protein LBB50_04620 [Oscillospiraceae bacterium]|jgi:hypothetical protein|nr:hypothetical protein [Oscillospiraceae bacterium]